MKKIVIILFSAGLSLLLAAGLANSLQQSRQPAAEEITIVDLGALGGTKSQAADINNLGQIVGSAAISGDLETHAFIWFDGSMTALNIPPSSASQANAINDDGLIAGNFISATGETSVMAPLLWAGEIFTPLASISATQATAQDINMAGLIAGHTLTETTNDLLLWAGEPLSAAKSFDAAQGFVKAISDDGAVVGYTEDISGTQRAFLWQAGSFTALGTLGGATSQAADINNLGQIVGTAALSDDLSSHAFLWEAGEMLDLGALTSGPPSPTSTSKARGVNNLGLIVGEAQVDGQRRAVLWERGAILDLNTLLPDDSPWERLVSASSVNDAGLIVGTGLIAGEMHGFLLERPLPLKTAFLPIVLHVPPTPPPTPTPTMTPTATPTPTPSPTPDPNAPTYDMAKYMADDVTGNGLLYEVRHSSGSQARHQTQVVANNHFFHTKGNEISAEWEELWYTQDSIFRGADTSPGNNLYYSLYDDAVYGSSWSPRYWQVGDVYARNPYVVFYNKSNCNVVASGYQYSWLRFEAYHATFTFDSGITLSEVVELAWLLAPNAPPEESYFYAAGYGLVGWGSADRGYSHISEIHNPGDRPNNTREVIACLNSPQTFEELVATETNLNFGRLPAPYRAK